MLIVHGLRGAMRVRMTLRLRFDYGALRPWSEAIEDGVVAKIRPDLHAPVPIEVNAGATEAVFTNIADPAAGIRVALRSV
jgi:hypothetical protein